jgi:hypothetical protein
MRLIILSQSRGVVALGVKGQGDTRDNFVTITLDRQRRATLAWDDATYALDTAPVVARASAPIPVARQWPLPQLADQSGARDLTGARGEGDQPGPGGPPQSDAEAGGPMHEAGGETGGGLDAEVIRTLIAAGWSKNKVCARLTGAKDKKLRLIDAALAGDGPGA